MRRNEDSLLLYGGNTGELFTQYLHIAAPCHTGIISKMLHKLRLMTGNIIQLYSVQPSDHIFVFSPVPSFQVVNIWLKLASLLARIIPPWPHTSQTGHIWNCEWQRWNLSPLNWRPLSCWMYLWRVLTKCLAQREDAERHLTWSLSLVGWLWLQSVPWCPPGVSLWAHWRTGCGREWRWPHVYYDCFSLIYGHIHRSLFITSKRQLDRY